MKIIFKMHRRCRRLRLLDDAHPHGRLHRGFVQRVEELDRSRGQGNLAGPSEQGGDRERGARLEPAAESISHLARDPRGMHAEVRLEGRVAEVKREFPCEEVDRGSSPPKGSHHGESRDVVGTDLDCDSGLLSMKFPRAQADEEV